MPLPSSSLSPSLSCGVVACVRRARRVVSAFSCVLGACVGVAVSRVRVRPLSSFLLLRPRLLLMLMFVWLCSVLLC